MFVAMFVTLSGWQWTLPQAHAQPLASPAAASADQQSTAAAKEKYPPTERDVVYGTAGGTTLKLDVFSPKRKQTRPRKAIVVIHGGSWTGYDKTILAPMSQFLQKHGFVVFSIDYRLVHDGENHWPAQLDDAQLAVRWVRAHATQYNIDPSHIGAFGHSSGAQMAALLGELDTVDNCSGSREAPDYCAYSSHVQAVVDASGPTDFLAFRLPEGDRILTNLMGMPANAAPEKWQAASPIWNVTPQTSPFLVLHDRKDHTVYFTQSLAFVDLMKLRGVPVKLVTTNGGHTYATLLAKFKLAYGSKRFFRKTLGD
jgi:acetyl esterase/lipase